MRLSIIVVAVLTCIAVPTAKAEPLVTISCDKPNGFNIRYSATLTQRIEASQKKQTEPAPALSGPNKDGYVGTPTFVIDSNKKDMTTIWAELPEDVELRKQAKEQNLPTVPPPPATNGTVVMFMEQQISAVEVDP